MTWALKRQIFFIVILFFFLAGIAFLIIYPKLNKPPTCFDQKQNGTETGVDCGGMCQRACMAQVDKVSVLWARAFKVIPGRYNAVAYLENHNKSEAVNKVSYKFRFADEHNVYIGKREGTAFIPPSSKFAIFEPAVDVGNYVPVYTTFEFTEEPVWIQVSPEKINQLNVSVANVALVNPETSPLLSATIKNNSLFDIPEVNVVAILYDANHNAVSVSETYIDELSGEESKDVAFTWREPFLDKVISEEILPIYNIFQVKLK